MIITPVILILGTVLIIYYYGWIGLLSTVILIIHTIFLVYCSKIASFFLRKRLRFTDKRNKLISNSLQSMKSIKFNAWESIILKKMESVRVKEVYYNFKIFIISIFNLVFGRIGPLIATVFTISVKMLRGEDLSLSDVFFIIALYNIFDIPLRVFSFFLLNYFEARLIFKRL